MKKRIILGTSDAWSPSRLLQQTSKPAYYIVDCQIFIPQIDSQPKNCQYPLINHLDFSSIFFVKLHDDKFAGMLITVLWKCSSCATPANPIHAKTWLGLFRICLTVRKVSVAKQNVKRRCFDSTWERRPISFLEL